MKTLAVVGAGTMGRGIAQLALQSGLAVRLFDAFPEALASARTKIREGLDKGVARGKLSKEAADAAFAHLTIVEELQDLPPAEFVIEAVSEDVKLKKELFRDLDGLFAKTVPLATNTSSIPVAEIAEGIRHPERVVGMHFFNPPVAMKLVEVIRHDGAAERPFRAAVEWAEAMGRVPVEVKDTPGFLVNRVVRAYYLVAQRLAAEGAGSFLEIDSALTRAGGMPMGPFTLMDFIGLEVNLKITQTIYEGLGRPERLKPHPIQEKLVALGCRGRKSGRGFYLYAEGKPPVENPDALALLPPAGKPLSDGALFDRILAAIHAEAEIVVESGVAVKDGVDTAVKLAMNFPKGPFEWVEAARAG
ncbi:MAG: 3-hydroxybutyryl-CoA dehydrogenase [Elusimicrobia bacterium CG_4_10_14_0_2_um_filter_63_34]|nr:MAG: 3-hydroxybutyryl-CoA dehydrogenase [Elusimicrobia bacterium CG_4_10_14_0_2_um_filter_63_34]